MNSSAESAELSHDVDGLDTEPYLKEALESVIEELISGGKVAGLTLVDHLDFLEHASLRQIIDEAIRVGNLRELIEAKLRVRLADRDEVHDRAAQMAEGRD